jgi:SH3 domain-containing protein
VRCGAAALLLLAAALPATAPAAPAGPGGTVYVIEQLVVNVNSAPDASGERIATVKSGDALEVIERSGEQVHVRLPGGRDGWVRAGYLSNDEPLRPRLAQREAEVAQLKDELARLQTQLVAARVPHPPAAPAPAAAAPAPEDPANPAPRALFDAAGDEPPRRVWPWALGWSLAALAAGFVLGALLLDRHIRRKYGGLRIY